MLTNITNLTYKEVLDIRKHILNTYSAKIHNGLNYYNHLLQTTSLTSTSIKNLDNLLGGGLLSGNIYEFCGFSSSGKTQICFTIAVNISQYFEKCIYYIDTKHDFSARKLQNILEERKISEEISGHILNRIKVKHISDQYELISALYDIKTELSEGLNCPLIIIDSLPAIFYRTGNYSNTKTVMNHFVNIARYVSTELNTVIIVTNVIVQEDNISANVCGSMSYKPGMGTYWLTVPNTRILLTKHNHGTCSLKVIKSTTTQIDKQCNVSITKCGVE
ncbi:Rad51 recombinase D [Carabus blaptoides fortunei]